MSNNTEELNIIENQSSVDENSQNNNHLGDKLNKHFSPLLFIGVFGGFILFIVFSITFIKKAQKNQTIKEALRNLNLQLTEQLIFEVEDILLYRTQSCFDLLRKLESNSIFFSSLYDNNKVNNIDNYIKDNSIHLSKVDNDTKRDEKKGMWGINEGYNNSDTITNNIRRELFIFTSLNPLLNSIYNSTNYNETYIENIFIINNKKELFYDFPVSNDTYFNKRNNRVFCFNEIEGTINDQMAVIIMPSIYDYHCQEWFADAIKLHRIIGANYYISSPYFIEKREKLLIMTFCLNSTKINNNNEIKDYYLFCLNARYQILLIIKYQDIFLLQEFLLKRHFITRRDK